MRRVVVCIVLGVMASIVQAASLPSGPYDTSHITCTSHQGEVDAFRVFCGTQPGTHDTRVSTLMNPGTELIMLAKDATGTPGTFYCVCTVIDGGVESVRSHEVGFQLVQTTSDTANPTVAITSPSTGAQVTRNTTITLRATASDNVQVDRVEFRVNGVLQCTQSPASNVTTFEASCPWKVPAANKKTYTLQARAYDAANNTNDSVVVTVRSQ